MRVDFGQYGWFPSIDAMRVQHPQNQQRRESVEEERTEESELDA
jgi:hypothetical protein